MPSHTEEGCFSEWPVFAFAVDLGSIRSTSSPVVWVVGYVRDPALKYTTPAGSSQLRRPYYRTQYDNAVDVVRLMRSGVA